MSKKLIEEIDGEDANVSLNLKVSEVSIKTSKQQKEDERKEREIGRESEREKEVISGEDESLVGKMRSIVVATKNETVSCCVLCFQINIFSRSYGTLYQRTLTYFASLQFD